MHKETVKTRPARVAAFKKDPEKKQIASSRAATPLSNASIFGSLKRGQGVAATSTPRSTPTATKPNDVRKTRVLVRNKPPDKEKTPWFRTTNNNLARREPIKSSVASLNVDSVQKVASAADLKKRRPISTPAANVTYRRGQNAKIDGQNLPDNLSRTSSITNLDAEQKINKGAKPRKSASRDRIDKIGENKKNDKKGVTKNNNKLESGDSPYPSIDSLQEEEFVQLRRQLQEMAQEKSNLALQLGEQKGQLSILQSEIQKLKCFQDESNIQLEHLTEENTVLRNRLRNVAHSPLSDNEKQQLLFETHRHHSSSAPASIATNLIEEGNGGDVTACPTPDWDKHSSSNVSEVSVACLQDKINQMQETHYSTNEELQATLQELTDLQRQLTELQQENERLNEEKTLMFDSLCRQTERLNDSRSEVESLKQLLYREKDETGQYESAVEREQKLVDLLKSAQEEREALIGKLEQMNGEAQEARAGIVDKDDLIDQLSNRVRTLESTVDAKHAEHKLMDQELAQAKDQCSGKQIEINRLTDLLDNARTKISELEQDRELSDKSELDELLDNARKEKDALESEVAHLKEQLAISKNETEKLREQVSVLQEECKVTRNNARTKQSDLEYKCEKLLSEKNDLSEQLREFQEAVNELQVQSQCQLEDKRQLSAVLSETQRNLSETERKNLSLENELEELKKLRAEENDEWEKFQNDLLTSVRVANDFKTEAQQELQRMIMENKSYRERERQLKAELEKLKGDKTKKGVADPANKSKLSETNTEMDGLLKFSRKSKDKPRKSKDSAETSSSESKLDKGKEKKPDILKKFVKQRDKQVAKARKNKTLSVEEEMLLKSLNDWYEHIDKNIPEENLTEEQKVVKKLKILYEDDSLKERPVAHKPKNQLAISKPLLDSVFLNPKLEEIVNDPNMPTIDEMGNFEVLSFGQEALELRTSPDKTDREAKGKSEDFGKSGERNRKSALARSKSYDDLYNLEEAESRHVLYRSPETYDLRGEVDLKPVQRESSILPSDSVSNPRYSDFTMVVYQVGKHKEPRRAKVERKSSVNFETLEGIVRSIPKDAPEHQLSSEQKFALRLKKSLDEAERKNTLKKQKAKNLVISPPTIDSVNRNDRLRAILLDPCIKPAQRRNSENNLDSAAPLAREESIRQSRSHEDIAFTFHIDPNASSENTVEDDFVMLSPNGSFSSAEFNIETGSTGPYDSRVLKRSKGNKLVSLYNLKEDAKQAGKEEFDSLEYNETLTRKLAEKDSTKEDQDFDLLYNETLNKTAQTVPKRKFVVEKVKGDDLDYFETLNKNVLVGKKETNLVDKSAYYQPISETVRYSNADLVYDKYFNATVDKIDEVNNEGRNLNKLELVESVNTAVAPISYVCEDASNVRFIKVEVAEPIENNVATFKGYEETSSEYAVAEVDKEYDYHSILKENKYGVVSPLNIRLSYKDVVREIKHKFPENYEQVDGGDEGDDDDIERRDAFFDDFFGVKPRDSAGNVSAQGVTSAIDRAMEDIFENYLHTPLSKVITQIEDSVAEPAKASNEKFIADVTDDAHTGENLDEIVLIIDDKGSTASDEDSEDIKEPSVEQKSGQDELETKEDVISELAMHDTQQNKADEGTQDANDQPPVNITVFSKADKVLTPEELNLVKSVKPNRFSRPLSEFNEDDLRIIQEISARYSLEETPQEHNEEAEEELGKNVEEPKTHDTEENKDQRVVNEINLKIDEEIVEIEPSGIIINKGGDDKTKVAPIAGRSRQKLKAQSNKDSDLDSMLKKIFAPKDIIPKRNRRTKSDETDSVEASTSKHSLKESDSVRTMPQKEENKVELNEVFKVEDLDSEVVFSEATIEVLPPPKDITSRIIPTTVLRPSNEVFTVRDLDEEAVFSEATIEVMPAPKQVTVIEDLNTTVTNKITPTVALKIGNEELDNGDDAANEVLPKEMIQKIEESSREEIRPTAVSKTSDEVFIVRDLDEEFVFSEATIEVVPLPKETIQQREESSSDDQTVFEVEGLDSEIVFSEATIEESSSESKIVEDLGSTVMDADVLKTINEIFKVEDVGYGVVFGEATIEELPAPKEVMQQREESRSNEIFKVEDSDSEVVFSEATIKVLPAPKEILQQKEESRSNDVFKVEDLDSEIIFSEATIEVLPPPKEKTQLIEESRSNEVFKVKDLDREVVFSEATMEVLPAPKEILQQREESRSNDIFKVKDLDSEVVFSEAIIEVLPPPKEITQQREDRKFDNLQQSLKENKSETKNEGEGDDDVQILLARMAATRIALAGSKRSVGVAEDSADSGVLRRKKQEPKYLLRNYEGVKSKLEYFTKAAGESPPVRQSFNLYPERAASDRRKVKSWAEHFERRSLDTHSSYEPVYANFKMLSAPKNRPVPISKIEKKPLPVPRLKNQGSRSVENLDSSEAGVKNDECLKEIKMSDIKNFSESKTENVPQEKPSSEVGPVGKFELPEVPEQYETTKPAEEGEKLRKKVLGIKKSEKFLGKMQLPGEENEENVKFSRKEERDNLASGADYSYSSIAVAGKSEQLDITKHTDEDGMEEIDNNNESTLNLFHLEASSYDESYLSLFKSPEDKVYDDISGQRKPRGYFNIAYLGEVSDGESLDDLSRHGMDIKHLKDNESRPRIIDFVPLDDSTEPVFNKHNLILPDYSTLEREKTYHVLNTAATSAKVRKSVSKIEEVKESRLSLPSVPSGSRTSFSAAKKVFEALVEANVDTTNIKKKKKKKKLDKSDKDEAASSVSSLETVEGEKVAETDN